LSLHDGLFDRLQTLKTLDLNGNDFTRQQVFSNAWYGRSLDLSYNKTRPN